MEDIILTFKEKKLKLTPQRLAVYQYLKSTTMSLATVYKTLKTLVEIGLVQELNVGEGNFRYDGNCKEHGHIQCIKCGKVNDLCNVDFSPLNKMVEENSNYKVKWNKLFFYGFCKDCQ